MKTDNTVPENPRPLVWSLAFGNDNHLDEWLVAHPPSRLGFPPAFNNGVAAQPIWVLAVESEEQLAELGGSITAEATFTRANQLAREAVAKIAEIQNDAGIPVHASAKVAHRSKKQCRTEVQDRFHEQIMLMAAEHPLWDQGRWTMIVKPQQVDHTFAQLAKSLATGTLRSHGSILAIRARPLPFAESTYVHNVGPKRKKSFSGRRSSSKNPSSARAASENPIGIDIFFHPVWNSSVARDVLQAVARVSGRMASFCKSSIYSCLGIRGGHLLASHSSLYSAKTLASPADVKLWTGSHPSVTSEMEPTCLQGDRGPSTRSEATSPSATTEAFGVRLQSLWDQPVARDAVRRDREPGTANDDVVFEDEEPAHKKARNAEETRSVQATSRYSEPETQESQEELILPLHRTAKAPQMGSSMVHEQQALGPGEESSQPSSVASVAKQDTSSGSVIKPTIPAVPLSPDDDKEPQTQPKSASNAEETIMAAREQVDKESSAAQGKAPDSSADEKVKEFELAQRATREDTPVSEPEAAFSAGVGRPGREEMKKAADYFLSEAASIESMRHEGGDEGLSRTVATAQPEVIVSAVGQPTQVAVTNKQAGCPAADAVASEERSDGKPTSNASADVSAGPNGYSTQAADVGGAGEFKTKNAAEALDSLVMVAPSGETDGDSDVRTRPESDVELGAQKGPREDTRTPSTEAASSNLKSQTALSSDPEMSIDDFLVEGVGASPTGNSQGMNDNSAK